MYIENTIVSEYCDAW